MFVLCHNSNKEVFVVVLQRSNMSQMLVCLSACLCFIIVYLKHKCVIRIVCSCRQINVFNATHFGPFNIFLIS